MLVSSYKNNAIVARLCGNKATPGIQLLFLKSHVFEDQSKVLERCVEQEVKGRGKNELQDGWDNFPTQNSELKAKKMSANMFPTGNGQFSITPFIPMEHLRWYRLQIQGQQILSSKDTGAFDDELYKFSVRIDPLNGETGDVEDVAPLHYDQGQFYPSKSGLGLAGADFWKLQTQKVTPDANGDRQPWCKTNWSEQIDLTDIYSLGNVYNNVCSDATDDVEWSIGALRNFRLFALQSNWLQQLKGWPDSMRNDRAKFESHISHHRARHQKKKHDLSYWLTKASEGSQGGNVTDKGVRVVRGLYQLSAELRQRNKKSSTTYKIKFANDWNEDHEPGWILVCFLVCSCSFALLLVRFSILK